MSPWTDLGGGLRVHRSRVWAMNSGLLLAGDHALVIDAGVLPSEIDGIVASVADVRARLVVYTHHHWDHVLAHPWLGATSVASEGFAAALAADLAHARREIAACAAEHGETFPFAHEAFAPDVTARPGARVPFGPWTLAFHDARGHCETQLAIHVPERRVLFAADMLSDREVPWLDRPAATYVATLERLRPVVESGAADVLVPGHGEVALGRAAILARFDQDLAYLRALADRASPARAAGASPGRPAGGAPEAAAFASPHPALATNPEMAAVHRRNLEIEIAGLDDAP